jgi:hypothetical protein
MLLASCSYPVSALIPSHAQLTFVPGDGGEVAVQRTFPDATIVRPSAMFGPGDALFATLAGLARLLPVLPLIGGGRMRLQPVYVEDVAEAVGRILADPGAVGRTYELAGPRVYTLRDLVKFTLRVVGKRRLLMPLPFAVAEIQARLFELLPSPPLTTGQVDLLKADSVASGALPGSPGAHYSSERDRGSGIDLYRPVTVGSIVSSRPVPSAGHCYLFVDIGVRPECAATRQHPGTTEHRACTQGLVDVGARPFVA